MSAPALSPAKTSSIPALLDRAGMLLILAALIIICSIAVPNFASLRNLDGLLQQVCLVGTVATTMLFCLASGNFDLSVGTLIPAGGVICALVLRETGSIPLAIIAPLAFGATIGLINGSVVAKLKINPLITTLSTMMIVKGVALVLADNGRTIGITNETLLGLVRLSFPDFRDQNGAMLFQIKTPVWIAIILVIVFGFILNRTVFGRNTLAVGGNEEAARLSGVATDRVKIIIFTVQGIVATLAGMLVAARIEVGDPKTAQGSELSIISACVLGGVSLSGGIGRMSHVVAGVFIMGIVENAMSLRNVDSSYQYIIRGIILLAAVIFDKVKQGGFRK